MKTTHSSGLLVLAAGMAASGTAVGQVDCGQHEFVSKAYCRSELDWTATCSGNTQGSMSGWVTAAWLESSYKVGLGCYCPYEGLVQSVYAWAEEDEATADCPNGSFSLHADASSNSFSHKSVVCCEGGNSVTASEAEWHWVEQWGLVSPDDCETPRNDCAYSATGQSQSVAGGWGAGALSLDFDGGYYTNYLPKVNVQLGYSFEETMTQCEENATTVESPLCSLYYTRIKLRGYPLSGPAEEEVHAAVFATRIHDGETVFVRLGFAGDAMYDPQLGSTYDYDVNPTDYEHPENNWKSLGGSLPSTMSRYSIDTAEDSFASFDGNVDGFLSNGTEGPTYCWSDRTALKAALGTSIGDEDYNPRADYDLDGTVDVSDVAAIVAVLGEVDIEGNLMRCLSFDFNCDGYLNANDYDDFASAFDVADPLADVNCDGFVNGNDYDEFVEGWSLGCP